jgi:hypothetical protein
MGGSDLPAGVARMRRSRGGSNQPIRGGSYEAIRRWLESADPGWLV